MNIPSSRTSDAAIHPLSLAGLWWGIGFTLVYSAAIIGFFWSVRLTSAHTITSANAALLFTIEFLIGFISLVGSMACLMICVGAIHSYLGKITRRSYPISALEGVLFNFIPLFNIYWIFKWPSEVIHFVNTYHNGKKRKTWAPGLFMLLASTGPLFWLGIGFWVAFWVVGHLMKYVRSTVSGMNLPISHYEVPKKSGKMAAVAVILIVVVAFIFVVGMLSAIAIPNILRARDTAKGRYGTPTPAQYNPHPLVTVHGAGASRSLDSYYKEFGLTPPKSKSNED